MKGLKKLGHEEEFDPSKARTQFQRYANQGAKMRLATKHPLLAFSAAFLGDDPKQAAEKLAQVEVLLKRAEWEQRGGGGVRAYAMTPKSLGLSDAQSRFGGPQAFSQMAAMSMRPSMAGPYGGGDDFSGMTVGQTIAAYKNMGQGGGYGGVGW